MKKNQLFLITLLVIGSITTAQKRLFYTDFATIPENINQIVGSTNLILENPTIGHNPDWEIGGHQNNQLAKKRQGHFLEGDTPLSKYGRLSLGGSAGYFLIKQVQGPCTIDIYWAVTNTERSLKVTLGNRTPLTNMPEKESAVIKSTFTYEGKDVIDIRINGQKGGLYLYDVLVQQ